MDLELEGRASTMPENQAFSFKAEELTFRSRSGDELIFDCPSCQRQGKLYWNVETGLYHCFVCGLSGKRSMKSMDKLDLETATVVNTTDSDRWGYLYQRHYFPFNPVAVTGGTSNRWRRHSISEASITRMFREMCVKTRTQVGEQTALLIPIYTGQVPTESFHRFQPGISSRYEIHGERGLLSYIQLGNSERFVFLTEGLWDMVSIALSPFPGPPTKKTVVHLCTLGNSLSEKQKSLLCDLLRPSDRVLIAYDNDQPLAAVKVWSWLLALGYDTRMFLPPETNDYSIFDTDPESKGLERVKDWDDFLAVSRRMSEKQLLPVNTLLRSVGLSPLEEAPHA